MLAYDGFKLVKTTDISYFLSENGVVRAYLSDGNSVTINQSLNDLELQLNPILFFRVSRQYMVNIERIVLGGVPRWKLWKQTIYIKFGFTDISNLKLLAKQGFTIKSSNFHKIPLVNHWIFRKISYLCPRIEVFFPYCYLYNIGKRPTSWFSIKVQFRVSYIY